MRPSSRLLMRFRRLITVGGAATAAILAFAMPAAAHNPVLLDGTDVLPSLSPIAVDGMDPFGFYGVLPTSSDVRSFQLTMKTGEVLSVELTIPDLAPENQLSNDQLPRLTMVAPDGTTTVITPIVRVLSPDLESGMNFLMLNQYTGVAVGGIYSFTVSGGAPERFCVFTGLDDNQYHGIERGALATDEQIAEWYATAP